MEPVEDELVHLIAELVEEDPRKAWMCQRIVQLATYLVDKGTEESRRDLKEMIVVASSMSVRPKQNPTPHDYPL